MLLYLRITNAVYKDLVGGLPALRAMSLAYTSLLAMVPLLAVTFSAFKSIGMHNELIPFVMIALEPLGEKSVQITEQLFTFVDNIKVGLLGIIGVALLIFTIFASGGRNRLQRISIYHLCIGTKNRARSQLHLAHKLTYEFMAAHRQLYECSNHRTCIDGRCDLNYCSGIDLHPNSLNSFDRAIPLDGLPHQQDNTVPARHQRVHSDLHGDSKH